VVAKAPVAVSELELWDKSRIIQSQPPQELLPWKPSLQASVEMPSHLVKSKLVVGL
jgi:hypothetical protein